MVARHHTAHQPCKVKESLGFHKLLAARPGIARVVGVNDVIKFFFISIFIKPSPDNNMRSIRIYI